MLRHRTTSGFTLNEVIIVVAVFVLMSTLSLPYLGSFYRNQNTGAYCKSVRQALYRASYRAIAGERNTAWGVKIDSGAFTVYSGTGYVNRLTQFDEVHDIPNTMTLTGLSEVRFSKYTGEPNVAGTVSIIFNSTTTNCATVVESGLVDL